MPLSNAEILAWLRETRPARLAELWRRADEERRRGVGDAVHRRGLIEISNYCVRECAYCGIRAGSRGLQRYRMTEAEIVRSAAQAVEFGYGTVVLQAGEDYGITSVWMAALVRRIKSETPLAVTLSLGERPEADLAAWRAAGAGRYLLRFETSDPELYRRLHPARPGQTGDRISLLRRLKALGYEVGSGVMVGLPGQSYASLAADIELFAALDLDMIGVGPFIPHPGTPLGRVCSGAVRRFVALPVSEHVPGNAGLRPAGTALPPFDQVPNTEELAYKVVALARLACPEANIPSTTALATINPRNGRELGLCRGANVVMPNVTPQYYRALYEIYPAKACIREDAAACHQCLSARILTLGRKLGSGPGGRVRRGVSGALEDL